MKILPQTRTGTWGLSLSVVFAVLFVVKMTFPLPIPSMAIFAIGIAGVVLCIVALFFKERSIVFYVVGGLISSFVIFLVGGELLFPH